MHASPASKSILLAAVLSIGLGAGACSGGGDPGSDGGSDGGADGGDGGGLPGALPFEYSRTDVGEALSPAEVGDFTRRLTGYWKKVDFFRWVLRTSHGVHESTGKPDYMVWWGGVAAYREGDAVRFYHVDPDGGGHNIMIPTPRVLASAIAGHLMTGDAAMAELAEQYCKGITATMKGMVYDEDDPVDWLMARNIAAFNHGYTTDEGEEKQIDYTGWYHAYEHWNTWRFEYADNPTWGPVWVTNMRSKDDVPHIFMVVPHLMYAAERAEDEDMRAACAETLSYLRKFAGDIVEQGYKIRTKDPQGRIYTPGYSGDPELDEAAGDLASFVMWDEFIPDAECNAKRCSALIGRGDGQGLDCGEAAHNDYEAMATQIHYYNHDIIRFFHSAHIANALAHGDAEAARVLLRGMAARIEGYLAEPDPEILPARWNSDVALLALRAAAFGLPLTSQEARLIHTSWGRAIDAYKDWESYDLWGEAIPQGQVAYRPGDRSEDDHWASIEDMTLVMEYCWSPFRNPAGVEWVDCELVRDPSRWDDSGL
ncbi:MAG: hypothetical protein JXR96_16195 [Deltaproteobacteria bacterium]|nr:hypothetical protein [Deltaproteobacteria bacterium]